MIFIHKYVNLCEIETKQTKKAKLKSPLILECNHFSYACVTGFCRILTTFQIIFLIFGFHLTEIAY